MVIIIVITVIIINQIVLYVTVHVILTLTM